MIVTSTGRTRDQYCSLWRPVLLHFALLESSLWIGGWEGGLLLADARGVEQLAIPEELLPSGHEATKSASRLSNQ